MARPNWQAMTVTQRLEVLRKWAGDLSQEGMGAAIGLDPDTDTYGHAERTGKIDKLVHRIYLRFPEIDASWLFRGLTGNVLPAVQDALSEAARALGLVPPDRRNKG